jgi:hypothetical protein
MIILIIKTHTKKEGRIIKLLKHDIQMLEMSQ